MTEAKLIKLVGITELLLPYFSRKGTTQQIVDFWKAPVRYKRLDFNFGSLVLPTDKAAAKLVFNYGTLLYSEITQLEKLRPIIDQLLVELASLAVSEGTATAGYPSLV